MHCWFRLSYMVLVPYYITEKLQNVFFFVSSKRIGLLFNQMLSFSSGDMELSVSQQSSQLHPDVEHTILNSPQTQLEIKPSLYRFTTLFDQCSICLTGLQQLLYVLSVCEHTSLQTNLLTNKLRTAEYTIYLTGLIP